MLSVFQLWYTFTGLFPSKLGNLNAIDRFFKLPNTKWTTKLISLIKMYEVIRLFNTSNDNSTSCHRIVSLSKRILPILILKLSPSLTCDTHQLISFAHYPQHTICRPTWHAVWVYGVQLNLPLKQLFRAHKSIPHCNMILLLHNWRWAWLHAWWVLRWLLNPIGALNSCDSVDTGVAVVQEMVACKPSPYIVAASEWHFGYAPFHIPWCQSGLYCARLGGLMLDLPKRYGQCRSILERPPVSLWSASFGHLYTKTLSLFPNSSFLAYNSHNMYFHWLFDTCYQVSPVCKEQQAMNGLHRNFMEGSRLVQWRTD